MVEIVVWETEIYPRRVIRSFADTYQKKEFQLAFHGNPIPKVETD